MKLHHYIIMFVAFVFSFFILYNYINQRSVAYNRTNIEYANALTSACHDAAKTINADNLTYNAGVWRTRADIERTLSAFYETLSRNFGGTSDLIGLSMQEKTPFVLLVDVDGFYTSHNVVFDEYGNATVPWNFEGVNAVSGLNTWAKSYGNYIVRYFLSDYIEVTTQSGNKFAGLREAAVSQMQAAGTFSNATLGFLLDEDQFKEEKSVVITSKLEKQINYLLNTQKINVDRYYTGYDVTMPASIGEDWSRLTKNPTVISFMQGNQEQLDSHSLNVFAYAAGELTQSNIYFVDGDLYYPLDAATRSTVTVTVNGKNSEKTVYTFNGNPITAFYYSPEEAAATGATPANY